MKFQMYAALDIGTKKQTGMMGSTGGELDEVKRMLVETNPYLLALTVIVSCLHSAFEMLAFKNGKQISFLVFLLIFFRVSSFIKLYSFSLLCYVK